jgi:Alpha/beta hydrolase of unknown function (DUF1400)/Acyl-coenzyme A:6-aminopenicillanic acid acyl-transferase
MSYLLRLIQFLVPLRHRTSRLQRLGLSLLLGMGIPLLVFATQVSASETVLLQYFDQRLSIPRTELQTFAKQGTSSAELQEFLQTTELNSDDLQKWLTTEISPGFSGLLPGEFLLIQFNKTLGDVLGREDLDPLKTALTQAYQSDQSFSVLEVLQAYPKPNVRLVLDRLERVYNDVSLFVTRINPVLDIAQQLLPELVCSCPLPTPTPSATELQPTGDSVYRKAEEVMKSAFALAESSSSTPKTLSLVAAETNSANYEAKKLVLEFGPFRPSITIGEMTRFVETGELSRGWRFYFSVANIDPEGLRKALAQQIKVDVGFLDKQLNNLLGEFVLYEVGQVIHTPSGRANIEALRSAVVLSAAADNQITPLELLQTYPLQQIHLDGVRLARLGSQFNRFETQGGVQGVVTDLESWLVQVQASAAKDVCDCDQILTAANPLVTAPLPNVSSEIAAQYLPANWQPIASHRENRGIIKVVWLQGTPYEMGYQHGQLLHDEIASIGPDVINLARLVGRGFALGRLAQNRTYPRLIEECQGLVNATQDLGITMDVCMVMAYADVFQEILGYTLPQELFWEGCNQFVATNGATLDGRLYHGSSVDNDAKPVPYVINNPVIFVRQPNTELPHVFVGYPGAIWPNSGMNVAGITLGLDTAHPKDASELGLIGRSNVQIMARILATATSFEEAKQIMESQPRVRANLIMISDGKSRQAGVFEFTGKSLAVRPLQDNGVLYVTNHFVLPEMYEKQPLPVDPSSQSRFDRFKQLMEPGQSSSYYGRIQPTIMAKILRDRVNPYTQQASPLERFDDDASPGGNGALRQAIYDPEGQRLWIAAGQPPVPENPFVCFSMQNLLGLPNALPCQTPEM